MELNLPNRLTLLRVIMIPVIMVALLLDELNLAPAGDSHQAAVTIGRYLALVLFIIASITDWLDGKIARERGLVTNFGKLMDPLADKILVMALFVAFVELDYFPAWVVVVILGREFAVTGLRTLAVEKGVVLQANQWGKSKTIAQIVTIIAVLLAICVRETLLWMDKWEGQMLGAREWEWWMDATIAVLMASVVFFTVVSGTLYIVRNIELLKE